MARAPPAATVKLRFPPDRKPVISVFFLTASTRIYCISMYMYMYTNTLVIHLFLFLNGPVCCTRHNDYDTAAHRTIDDDDFATFHLLKNASCLGLSAPPPRTSQPQSRTRVGSVQCALTRPCTGGYRVQRNILAYLNRKSYGLVLFSRSSSYV